MRLSPDQLVLLLECLLEKKTLCSKMLECLQKTCHLREQDAENAVHTRTIRWNIGEGGEDRMKKMTPFSGAKLREPRFKMGARKYFLTVHVCSSLFLKVRHRWCELVIKHKFKAGYVDVEKFLKEDQAMGVYLYGELMVNEDATQQEIAYRSFAATRDQMDPSSAKWLSSAPEEKLRWKLS
ncbi:Aminopeptidase O [Varanus komodoensis]|nr:Aminopeptidase O [Varanus komodoensis]